MWAMTARTGLGYECETDHAQTNCSSLADQCRFNEHSVYISKRSLEYVLALCQPLALHDEQVHHRTATREVLVTSLIRPVTVFPVCKARLTFTSCFLGLNSDHHLNRA